jgi:sporulation protein YlmC with PRC-barrel domain
MTSQFQYIAPSEVVIEGIPATGMTICAATGRAVGRLRGFIVDATERHIRYLVVRGSGLFAKTTLLPFAMPQIDFEHRTIRVDVTDQQLRQLRDFTPEALLA